MRGERELGLDPESGKKVLARMGRYGPMVQMGEVEDEEKPSLQKFLMVRALRPSHLKKP